MDMNYLYFFFFSLQRYQQESVCESENNKLRGRGKKKRVSRKITVKKPWSLTPLIHLLFSLGAPPLQNCRHLPELTIKQ